MQKLSRKSIKLSIIIPYYDTLELTQKLLLQLGKQVNEEVEVILIDDGSHEYNLPNFEYLYTLHLPENSGNASVPRNIGLDFAKGKYVAFIDSDDYISDDYIKKINAEIEKEPDIIFLSWESKSGKTIMMNKPPHWNCSVWCRVYKKEIIGKIRFDETLRIAEDWKFNQEVKYKTSKCIRNVIYFYNNGREGSLTNSERKN